MRFPELFSKRGEMSKGLRYDLAKNARKRLLLVFDRVRQTTPGPDDFMDDILRRLEQRLLERYGDLCPGHLPDIHPVVQHFLVCPDVQALDFIEAVFTSLRNTAAARRLVDEFNRVFREEAIGYELTPFSQRTVKGPGGFQGQTFDFLEFTYPIIRKRGDTPQEESMTQCLLLLTDPNFKVANEQFLKAFQHYRASEWDQVIAYCGSAFESTLKAVLGKKRVAYKTDATANVLIQECVKAGIFPKTYENSLIGIANVRNAMSDTTHGRTPATQIVPDQKNAEHLLFVTAANIVFISKC
jgi:hypothetical protein